MQQRIFAAVLAGLLAGLAATAAPLLQFAAIGDIQYADKPPMGTRHYRASVEKLRQSATELNRLPLAFVIHLGDLTDGQKTPALCRQDVATIAAALKSVTAPWKFVLGNHDAQAGRQWLADALGFKDFYYTFTLPAAAGWRFVVLDGNDAGLGAVSAKQLAWFRGVLQAAQAKNERVLCFCHYPLLMAASPRKHIMRKPEPLLAALDEVHCVVAWINGHDHSGGYAFRNGVHHLTTHGMCETPDQSAVAIIGIFPDHLSITGLGREPTRELPLAAPAVAPEKAEALRPAA
jgi:3',5'-cyclic AMP phosphodiesterase CpdA